MFDLNHLTSLMDRGGAIMWPLLALSVIAVTFMFERFWFFLTTNNPGRLARVREAARLLRAGDQHAVRGLMHGDRTVYGRFIEGLLDQGVSDAAIIEGVETQRPRLERFLPMLSTIITAAPLLGILGTVVGIISSFEVLSDQSASADPRSVSGGIAQALLTTAAGLTIAIVVLFAYNAFRTQVDRTLSRLEMLAAAASAAPITSPQRSDREP